LQNPSFSKEKLLVTQWKGKDWIPAMAEGLKLIIFSYIWGKCVKYVEK
jgi:hypothetical protein